MHTNTHIYSLSVFSLQSCRVSFLSFLFVSSSPEADQPLVWKRDSGELDWSEVTYQASTVLESLRNGSQHDLQPRNLSVSRPPFTLESARISRFLCPSQPSSFPFSLSAQIIDVFSISEFTLLPLELSINGESTKSRRGDLFLLLPQS